MHPQYDCIVMGAGPAGSTAAALVAQAGHRTLLVEREKFPRFHVGESLMPETYWTFRRLGVLDRMKQNTFVKKVSVQFVSHTGKESQPFTFTDHDPRECAETWQVERDRFDQLLFDNAREKGAECHDQTRVKEVLFDGDRARGVRLQLTDSSVTEVEAKVVVDATGQQALLANKLGLVEVNPELRKAAIWNYYRGARRPPGVHAGATVILHTLEKNSWFWFIPQSNDITSIGVVGNNDYLLKGRGAAEQAFQQELAICPKLMEWLHGAERVGQFHVAKEFSYSTRRSAGDGWVLIGDAWGFIDPIYSSGVFFAMKSGELAADAIVDGLAAGDVSAAQLGRWCDDFADGTRLIRKLVGAFYTNPFSFGKFLQTYPQYRSHLTDLLIGRIFREGVGDIFNAMDPWLEEARAVDEQRAGASSR